MRYVIFAAALLCSCNKSDSAKDKEIAELKAKLVEKQTGPSLGSVSTKAEPRVTRDPEVTTKRTVEEGFTLDAPGQADRLEYMHAKVTQGLTDLPPEWTWVMHNTIMKWAPKFDPTGIYGVDIIALSSLADKNKSVTYEHLKKNAIAQAGKPWRMKGEILEISETMTPPLTIARINVWGRYDSPVWVACKCRTEFVQYDVVDVVGLLAGTYSYQSQAGWNITIPALSAYAIDKGGSIGKAAAFYAGELKKGKPEPEPGLAKIQETMAATLGINRTMP